MHPRLSDTTLRVARLLASLNPCRPGIAYVMRRLGLSRRCVQNHLRYLREAGLLVAPPTNLMRFILLSPYARTLCGEWEDGWADPFTHELRMEVQNATRHSELRVIAEELHGIPELTALWHAASESSRSAMVHDGKVRLIRPPASSRLHRVRLLVSSPAHDPRRRYITLQPTPEITMSLTPSTPREIDAPGADGWPPVPGPLVWMPFHDTTAA